MNDDREGDEARARVSALLDDLARLDLQVVVVAKPDAARRAARDRARDAARDAGRLELLDEATAAVREAVMQMFARAGFSGTWAVTDMAVSVARADDRVAASAAFEEAAIAAVVADLVDEETLDILRSSSAEFTRLKGLPSPGSLATIGTPAASVTGPWSAIVIMVMLSAIVIGTVSFGVVTGGVVALFTVAVIVGLLRRQPRSDP